MHLVASFAVLECYKCPHAASPTTDDTCTDESVFIGTPVACAPSANYCLKQTSRLINQLFCDETNYIH